MSRRGCGLIATFTMMQARIGGGKQPIKREHQAAGHAMRQGDCGPRARERSSLLVSRASFVPYMLHSPRLLLLLLMNLLQDQRT